MTYNIIFILLVLATMLVGYFRGFGKSLKTLSGGIVGIILAGAFCFIFGSSILAIPFIYDLVGDSIVRKIIYYIVLFVVAQLLRIVIFTIIKNIMEIDNVVINVINRVGGAMLAGALTVISVVALVSTISRYADTFAFCANILEQLESSFLINFAVEMVGENTGAIQDAAQNAMQGALGGTP